MEFQKITEISLSNNDWKKNVFITIDVDWAIDEVLKDTIDLFIKNNVKATILLTHQTDLIKDISDNSLFELGIHPNFNFLLNGDFRYGKNYKEVIDYYLKIVPDAKVVRSHSVTQNSNILDYYKECGLIYDLNSEVPYSSGIKLRPYLDWTGLIKVPYLWQENISFKYKWELDPLQFINYDSLTVFNFHPIHIFLNSENQERYNLSKDVFQNYIELKKIVNYKKDGIRNFLKKLIMSNR
jgi:hypothetical protein